MKCKEVKKLLSAYLDDELSMNKRQLVEEHLKVCSDCALEFASFQSVDRLTTSLIPEEPPEEYWEEYSSRLLRRVAPKVERKAGFSLRDWWLSILMRTEFRVATAAAGVVLILLIGVYRLGLKHGREEILLKAKVEDETIMRDMVSSEVILIKALNIRENVDEMNFLRNELVSSGLLNRVTTYKDSPDLGERARSLEMIFIKIVNAEPSHMKLVQKEILSSGVLSRLIETKDSKSRR